MTLRHLGALVHFQKLLFILRISNLLDNFIWELLSSPNYKTQFKKLHYLKKHIMRLINVLVLRKHIQYYISTLV